MYLQISNIPVHFLLSVWKSTLSITLTFYVYIFFKMTLYHQWQFCTQFFKHFCFKLYCLDAQSNPKKSLVVGIKPYCVPSKLFFNLLIFWVQFYSNNLVSLPPKTFIPVLHERTTMDLLLNYSSQLCPNLLKAIYIASTSSRHLGSSLKDINTSGNETQSNGFKDWEVRRLTEMPLHLI